MPKCGLGRQRLDSRFGQHVGRPAQAEDAFLVKYAAVKDALASGLSLGQTAAWTGVAVNTRRKVQKLIADQ